MSVPASEPVVVAWRIDATAVLTLFRMTVARLVRGKRLLVLALLYSLPIAIALLAQRYNPNYDPEDMELGLIFGLIPQTLLPLTALVFASGMIADEVEEQTLTYLLVRPLPRPMIYATKLAATWAVMAGLAAVFTALAYAVVFEFDPTQLAGVFPSRVLRTIALMLLALAAYGSFFSLVSLFVRPMLAVGVAYIFVVEGIFANIEFVIRNLTILYQFRVLAIRWIRIDAGPWSIDLALAPSLGRAALNLAVAALAFTVLGSLAFARREFRVKTPEST
jgi:ABC-2 type transport system permease protein